MTSITQHVEAPAPRAGRKEWIGLAVLTLPALLISMDMSVLLFGLPFISASLKPSATQQLWIMDMYGFALAGLLITMGAIGDRIGRRQLLLLGALAFGGASAAAAYSDSAATLIAMRALLGVAGATLMPSTLALIRNMFHDEKQRKSAIGIWTGGAIAGVTVGPIVGGLLLNHFWWGSVFLINLPAMALLLVAGPLLLPEFRTPATGRFDFLGSVLSMASILPTVYGIKELAVNGFSAGSSATLCFGVAMGILFVIRQRTAAHPLIDIQLFGDRDFRSPMVVNAAGNFVLMGFGLFNTQYLQSVAGMRPFTAALWSLAAMPFVVVGMAVTGVAAAKARPSRVLGAAFLVGAAGAVALIFAKPGVPILVLLVGAGIAAAGAASAQVVTADMILAAAPPERAGAASALNETSAELGSALGMAILGSIGAAIYHHRMADVAVAGLSGEATRSARETVGGANAVAAQLQSAAGNDLLTSARDAFASGLHAVAVGGVIVLLFASVFAARSLRHLTTPPVSKDGTSPETVATELAAA